MDKVSYVSLWEETTARRRARTNLIDIAALQIPLHVLPLCSRRQCDEIYPLRCRREKKNERVTPVEKVGSHLVSQHIFGVLCVGSNTVPAIIQTPVSENSRLAINTLLVMFFFIRLQSISKIFVNLGG